MTAKATTTTVIPCLQYRDAPAMIDWLCRAFGFEKKFVVEGENGVIEHSQLTFGNGMLMVSTARNEGFSQYMRQPDEAGGGDTQSSYLAVVDADAHYKQAVAAGAEILIDIADQDYGGRLYVCRDPEGHIWSIGSYDPWDEA